MEETKSQPQYMEWKTTQSEGKETDARKIAMYPRLSSVERPSSSQSFSCQRCVVLCCVASRRVALQVIQTSMSRRTPNFNVETKPHLPRMPRGPFPDIGPVEATPPTATGLPILFEYILRRCKKTSVCIL